MLRSVSAVDSLHAWAVGDDGTVIATTDGGVTWALQRPGVSDSLSGVSFVDSRHGWVVVYGGPPHVIATSDGGATWMAKQLPFPYLNSVSLIDLKRGWVIGDFGTVFTSTNGGDTFRRQRLEKVTWPTGTSASLGRSVDSLCVAFTDVSHGWAVGDWGTIQATTDGGITWRLQRRGAAYSPSLDSVCFADIVHGWAVGNKGVILATTDGGANWRAQFSGSAEDLSGVAFVDSLHGWVVGTHGVILATTDGGARWEMQRLAQSK